MNRESPVALAVRDALHEAVARIVAGGAEESVWLPRDVWEEQRDGVFAAAQIDRGIYLATWGRPVSVRWHARGALLVAFVGPRVA